MTLQFYPVPITSAAEVNECLTRHLSKIRKEWEFASDDIQEPITFATIITMDTLAPVIMALSKAGISSDRLLASGWSYRRLDLGDPRRVDFIFTAPEDQKEGFIFRVEPSRYIPGEIASVSAYLFTDRKFWYPSSKNAVVDALKNKNARPAAFEYNPQYPATTGRPFMAHGSGRPFDPESVLAVLPPLIEAMSTFDPKLFAESLSSHAAADYQTLFQDKQDILIATRGVMAKDGNLAGPALARFVDFVWREGMRSDLDTRMADIDRLAKLLLDQGNTSKRKEFDFDDDKYGAYLKVDGDKTTVFFRHEKDAMAIARSKNALVISAANYKTGETSDIYVDLRIEDGHVVHAYEASALRSHVTSLLRRWVREIEGLGDEMEEVTVISPVGPAI
ncbi:hypothetical protein HFO56_39550 [Rhizobium laguerreae]|uniref:hypothetical protein n=1 Tax=Rhizobium laguerreae TaxID=1076926 RepID=UPI001C92B14D|nr:hypothetical protein [Rhizobium laguerreae]MBY3158397.1 hypothetical protein [Rhizobium laguerreae]